MVVVLTTYFQLRAIFSHVNKVSYTRQTGTYTITFPTAWIKLTLVMCLRIEIKITKAMLTFIIVMRIHP